jgi:hypothetical protein
MAEKQSAVDAAIISLAETQKALVAQHPLRQLTYPEMLERDPEPVMPFPVFQNGFRLDATALDPEALALLHKLQVGRFFDRRIHVYRDQTPDHSWHIDYSNRSISDRMEIKNYGLTLTAILKRLTTETPDLT